MPLSSKRNLWSLTVLCLLLEQARHPYEMQRVIRERHNDEFLDLKRGSLYHAIERLLRAGLIAELETSREGKRPERTVYQITPQGEREVLDWLREMIAKPERETSSFYAALSFAGHLTCEEVKDQLRLRAKQLECALVSLEAVLTKFCPQLPRVFLLEAEYSLEMRRAELGWARAIADEIESGTLAWRRGGSGCDPAGEKQT